MYADLRMSAAAGSGGSGNGGAAAASDKRGGFTDLDDTSGEPATLNTLYAVSEDADEKAETLLVEAPVSTVQFNSPFKTKSKPKTLRKDAPLSQYQSQQKTYQSQVEVASNRRTVHKGSVVLGFAGAAVDASSGTAGAGAQTAAAAAAAAVDMLTPSKMSSDNPTLKQIADQKSAAVADAKSDPKNKDREALPQRLIDYFIVFGLDDASIKSIQSQVKAVQTLTYSLVDTINNQLSTTMPSVFDRYAVQYAVQYAALLLRFFVLICWCVFVVDTQRTASGSQRISDR